jgi:hypothetical protein
MTQEEELKAKELFDKFKEYAYVEWHGGGDEMTNDMAAKECAIIAVDEIISACEYNHVESWNTDWWNGVKTAINNL